MKIVKYYEETAVVSTVAITAARLAGAYTLLILFSDGTEKLVDFKPFLLNAVHPSITKYLDEELFMQYTIEDGNLAWNNYDLIFPVHDLYKGRIS